MDRIPFEFSKDSICDENTTIIQCGSIYHSLRALLIKWIPCQSKSSSVLFLLAQCIRAAWSVFNSHHIWLRFYVYSVDVYTIFIFIVSLRSYTKILISIDCDVCVSTLLLTKNKKKQRKNIRRSFFLIWSCRMIFFFKKK